MAAGKDKGGSAADRLEWVAAGLAALVVLAILGALLWEAVAGVRTPPDLAVVLEPAVPTEGGAQVGFTVTNRGGRAASAVGVALRLEGDGFVRRVTLDYVPGRSEVSGAFVLGPGDLARARVGLVEGYVDP